MMVAPTPFGDTYVTAVTGKNGNSKERHMMKYDATETLETRCDESMS